MYLTPNRRQRQHSLISSGYVKLIAVRTRGDRHRRRRHQRRASFVTPIIARAFSLSLAFPSSTRRKPKRGDIISVVDVAIVIVVVVVVVVVVASSRKPPPIVTALVAFGRRAEERKGETNIPRSFVFKLLARSTDFSDRSAFSSQFQSLPLLARPPVPPHDEIQCARELSLRARSSPIPFPLLPPVLLSRITRQEKHEITDDRLRLKLETG